MEGYEFWQIKDGPDAGMYRLRIDDEDLKQPLNEEEMRELIRKKDAEAVSSSPGVQKRLNDLQSARQLMGSCGGKRPERRQNGKTQKADNGGRGQDHEVHQG